MKLPYKLTLEDVTLACRKAYEEKRLTAQRGGECVYRDGRYRCAIGAAMPLALLNRLAKNRMMAEGLNAITRRGYVDCGEDYRRLMALQEAHDSWVTGGKVDEKAFLKALERCEAEVARRAA